jgi:hypothetical protein
MEAIERRREERAGDRCVDIRQVWDGLAHGLFPRGGLG